MDVPALALKVGPGLAVECVDLVDLVVVYLTGVRVEHTIAKGGTISL